MSDMRMTSHTLYDQMCFTETEISARKSLLAFSSGDAKLLADWLPRIEGRIDGIIESFYDYQVSVPELALIIGDADTLKRLKGTMKHYLRELFSGSYGAVYVNDRLRIGQVHKRIGVQPKHYIAALRQLEDLLLENIARSAPSPQQAARVTQAVHKLLLFDTTLVFDSYIQNMVAELETARSEAESHAQLMELQVRERTLDLEQLAQHDSLTGLYSRRACFELLHEALEQAKASDAPVALLYIDVDGLGRYNNSAGHSSGDDILSEVGAAMLAVARATDVLARLSGDEFCALLPDSDLAAARRWAKRLCKSFAQRRPEVTLSIGLAQTGPHDYMDRHELLHAADAQMFIAKQTPGFKVVG